MRCNWQDRESLGNYVATLTYEDNFLFFTEKGNATLRFDDFQRFMKRLRKRFPDRALLYLCRGEYGGKLGRPHFHVILFGTQFHSINECGFVLSDLWPYGGVMVDVYSGKAVRYVTKYITDPSKDGYVSTDEEMEKPIFTASKRPCIGYNFFKSKTFARCLRNNDYYYLDDDNIIVPLPKLFVKKADGIFCGDVQFKSPNTHLEENSRKLERARKRGPLDKPSFASPNGQVQRGEYINQQRRKNYIKSKAK